MKVIVTPPGVETPWPFVIRLIMHLPIARYRRWRLRGKAIRKMKPMLIAMYNLPARMPDDFAFTYDYKVFNKEKKRTTVTLGSGARKKVVTSEKLPTVETTDAFSAEQEQSLYDAVRKLGFIHFETHDDIDVSFDFVVQTDYRLICHGREYSYSCSTTEPTRAEWSEEEFELDELINRIASQTSGKN